MKKVLPCEEPTIRTYLGDAFCFSIINKYAFSTGWIYDKYIYLQYTPEDEHIKYCDYDYYDFVQGEGVFIKSYTQIPIEKCNSIKICGIIEDMINDDEYFFALFDESIVVNYLTGSNNSDVFEHGCFVYGYDSEEKIFFLEGYVEDEQWEKYEIPYDVFYNALSYYPEKGEIAFIGYQLKRDYDWKFDYRRMYRSLLGYLNYNDNSNMNLNAESKFFEQMLISKEIHYPSAYCLLEHKQLMKKRILFLVANNFLNEREAQINLMEEIEKGYEKILMLVIKYNVSYNKKILHKLSVLGNELITKEYNYLTGITKCIKKNISSIDMEG